MTLLLIQFLPLVGYISTLADANATPGNVQMLVVGLLCAIGVSLLGALSSAVTIWDRLRSKPPMHTVYATKGELAAMEERQSKDIAAIFDKLDAQQRTLQSFSNDVCREIGKLESKSRGKEYL